jgi:peptidoglycan/LPS O-acetylase OafA/YrhL
MFLAGAGKLSLKLNPKLDGVRALAVALVMVCHFFAHSDPSGLGVPAVVFGFDLRGSLLNLGSVGVAIFFVLSAYLLTDNLQSGSYKNLSHYYQSRYRRIFPAFFAFTILYLLCYQLIGKYPYGVDVNPFYALTSTIFAQPLFLFTQINSVDILPGTWSLYTEIYFYVLLPLVFWFMTRLKQKVNAVILLIFLTWVIRPLLISQTSWTINGSVFAYLDYFLLGVLLAFYKDSFIKLGVSLWLGLLVSLSSVALPLGSSEAFSIRGLGAFLIVASCLRESNKGFLASKPVVWLGQKSYGLFLSHIFVFWYLSVPLLDYFEIESFYIRFFIGGLIAFCISLILSSLSYRYLENPMKRSSASGLIAFSLISLLLIVVLSLDFDTLLSI